MQRLVFGMLLALGWGCTFPELSVHGKDCNNAHPCPDPFVCVQHPVSETERAGKCFRPEDAEPCPADRFCDEENNWVLSCDDDGFSSAFVADCDDESEICNQDTGRCAADCSESPCAAGETCDTGIGLCRPLPDCPDSACVPAPTEQPATPGGQAALGCFTEQVPAHDPDPPTCALTGRVNLFPLKSGTDETVGLTVCLYRHDAPPPHEPVKDCQLVDADTSDGGRGHYRFEDVACGDVYEVQISAGTSASGMHVVTTVRANVQLRADDCVDGVYTLGLDAVRESDYQTYTEGVVSGPDYNARGLLVGRVADCDGESMSGVTVGLAAQPPLPGRVYYFADPAQDILLPDTGLSATSTKGTYAAAGVPACRNQVGFKALQSTTVTNLGLFDFTMRPGAVVILDLITPEQRLP